MFNRKSRIENLDTYVEERLSDYLDGTLPRNEREIVEAHLASSERARASLESLRYTVSLLKQTPAPPMPRQFTLPVTSRAPARGAPGWVVWGLRGVAIGATASFVLLLTATLLRQPNPMETANLPAAMSQVQPSAVVALAPTQVPFAAAATSAPPNEAPAASVATPLMITTEPESTTELQLITVTPAPEPSQADAAQPEPPTDIPPPPPAQPEPPTETSKSVEPVSPTDTLAITENANADAAGDSATVEANAAGSAPAQNTPVFVAGVDDEPTATGEAQSQRTILVSAEGVVITSDLRVREGPGLEYDAIGGLKRGARVRVLGRDADSNWLAIEYPDNLETGIGWVGALFMDVSVPLEILTPLDPSGVQLPTATPTGQVPTDELKNETPTELPPAETSTPELATTPEGEPSPTP